MDAETSHPEGPAKPVRRARLNGQSPARDRWWGLLSLLVGVALGGAVVAGAQAFTPASPACTFCVLGTLDVGYGPQDMVFDPENGHLFVTDSGPGGFSAWGVTIVNATTNTVLGHVATGQRPGELVFDPRNGVVYVGGFLADNLTELSGAHGNVLGTVTLPPVPEFGGPYGLSFDPTNGYIDALDTDPANLVTYDPASAQVVGNYSLGVSDAPITTNPATGEVFVATGVQSIFDFRLTGVNGSTGAVISSEELNGSPQVFDFDPANGLLYVAVTTIAYPELYNGSVDVLADNGTRLLGSFAVGQYPLSMALAGLPGTLAVGNYYSSNLTVVNLSSNRPVESVPLGYGPESTVYDSHNGCLYTLAYEGDSANSVDGYVSVLSTPGSQCTVPPTSSDVLLWGAGAAGVLGVLAAVVLVYPRRSPPSGGAPGTPNEGTSTDPSAPGKK